MRAVSRLADVSINTVSKLLVDAGHLCSALHDEQVRGVHAKRVQMGRDLELYLRQGEERAYRQEGSGWRWRYLDLDGAGCGLEAHRLLAPWDRVTRVRHSRSPVTSRRGSQTVYSSRQTV